MADIPYRLAVQQKLTEWLKGITPANGYAFDLSNSVYRGRAIFSGDNTQNPLPMLSILESAKPDNAIWAGDTDEARSESWHLLLQGWVADDLNNPTDPAHYLMAAVEKRLSDIVRMTNPNNGMGSSPAVPEIFMLGDRPGGGKMITSFKYGPGVVRPPAEQVSSKAFFYLPLRVGLASEVGNPYIAG